MRRSILFTLLAGVAATLGALAQTVNVRPGQYEFRFEMDLGIPAEGQKAVLDAAGLQKGKKLECLTADEVKGDITKMFASGFEEENCKMSDVKSAASKLTFTTTCVEDDVRMTLRTEMTFDADAFTTVTNGKDNEGRVTWMKLSAKRIGECTK